MGFWFGTFIFFLIQVVVTVSINTWAKRPNKGCVPCSWVHEAPSSKVQRADGSQGIRDDALTHPPLFPHTPNHHHHRLPHLLGITAVAQCWLV